MDSTSPPKRKKRKKSYKTAIVVASATVFAIGAGFAGFFAQQNNHEQATVSSFPTSHSDSSMYPEPTRFIFPNWLSKLMSGGVAHVSDDQMKQFEAAQKVLSPLLTTMLLGGFGLWIYTRASRRKFIEFDKLGVLITDARKRESMSAKFVPWGCLESIEVLNFDLDADGTINPDEAANESSKATLLFHVDDGSTVKIHWRDVVRCVEPGPFINALKTYAPNACPQFQALAGDAHKVDKNTYTQLWFRYYSTGSERKRTTHLVAGELLQDGRYEVAGQIGGGGQGTAYVAVDSQAEPGAPTEVVLKEYILPVHRGQQVLQQTVQKLEQEAAILRKIDHANIVKLLGSFVEDHRGYLVMEYVQGRSLKEIVQQQGPQNEGLVMDLARQICDVLSYLHCQDPIIIHRDLTPDNLILQDNGFIKLVDFNVAHQLESAATATVVGKHCYIPPEQFRGRPTVQSDIYAFGCTLHYLLTAQEPEPLTPSKPKLINDAVSEELNDIIAKSTALDGARRYANVAEMHEALNAAPSAKLKVTESVKVKA